jgi:hypothetical protein
MTNLASNLEQRKWTKAKLPKTYIDLLIDVLIDNITGKYVIMPVFDRGYDDPLTKEIYFEHSSDAQAFQVLIKDIVEVDDNDEIEPEERSIFYHDEE